MLLQRPALCDCGKSRAAITASEALCDLDSTRLPGAFPLLLPLAQGTTLALLPGLSIQVYFASRMLDFLSLLLELTSPRDYLSLLVFRFQLKGLLPDLVS